MRLTDENGISYSDKCLRDICLNFVLAGRDTSLVALRRLFWLLDHNNEMEEKIVEICRVVSQREGGYSKGINKASIPTYQYPPPTCIIMQIAIYYDHIVVNFKLSYTFLTTKTLPNYNSKLLHTYTGLLLSQLRLNLV